MSWALRLFGFDKRSLSFIFAYLYKRKQKTNVSSEFRDLLNKLFGVPQRLILKPILFIIFIGDLFLLKMILILPAKQMIPPPTFMDRISLKFYFF